MSRHRLTTKPQQERTGIMGPSMQKPDLDVDVFEEKKNGFLRSLKKKHLELDELGKKNTRL